MESRDKKPDNDEFFRYLASEKKNGTIIHGLLEYEEILVDKYMSSIEKGVNETQETGKLLNRPFLKVDFPSLGRLQSNQQYFQLIMKNFKVSSLLVAEVGKEDEFLIGRSAESTITLHLNTISRKQCKYFEDFVRYQFGFEGSSTSGENGS